jgi:hypothetical protein
MNITKTIYGVVTVTAYAAYFYDPMELIVGFRPDTTYFYMGEILQNIPVHLRKPNRLVAIGGKKNQRSKEYNIENRDRRNHREWCNRSKYRLHKQTA